MEDINIKSKTLSANISYDDILKKYVVIIYDDDNMLELMRYYKTKDKAIAQTRSFLSRRKHLKKRS